MRSRTHLSSALPSGRVLRREGQFLVRIMSFFNCATVPSRFLVEQALKAEVLPKPWHNDSAVTY